MNDQDHGIWDKSSMTPPTVNANKILSPMTILGHYFLIHDPSDQFWWPGGDPGEVTTAHHGSGSLGARAMLVISGQCPSPALPLKQDAEHVLQRSSQSHSLHSLVGSFVIHHILTKYFPCFSLRGNYKGCIWSMWWIVDHEATQLDLVDDDLLLFVLW